MAAGIPSRASNKARQARCEASWKRGQERKAARVKAQTERALANAQSAFIKPWEQAKAKRFKSREAKHEAYLLKKKAS